MHLFILPAKNMHSYTLIYNLVATYNIEANKLKVIFFDVDSKDEIQSDIIDIEGLNLFFSKDLLEPSLYEDIKTVTILSLFAGNTRFTGNSEVISQLLKLKLFDYDQLIIRVTDDEVNRWHAIYQSNGKLIKDEQRLVDEGTLDILSKVSKFICLHHPWGDMLKEALGRELTIYDVNMITNKFLDDGIQNAFNNHIRPSILQQLSEQNTVRLLVYTYQQKINFFYTDILPDLKKFIQHHSKLLKNRSLEIALWWPPTRDLPRVFASILTLKLLAKRKSVDLRFTFLNRMPRETYFAFLSSVHVLVAQDRGGLGGIYEAARGGSLIAVKLDTLNAKVLSNLEGLAVVSYNNNEGPITKSLLNLSENNFEDLNKKQFINVGSIFEKVSTDASCKLQEIYS